MWPLTGNISSGFCMLRSHEKQNIRLYQAQDKMMQTRDMVNTKMYEVAAVKGGILFYRGLGFYI